MCMRSNNIKAMFLIETKLTVILTHYYFNFDNYIRTKIIPNYMKRNFQ